MVRGLVGGAGFGGRHEQITECGGPMDNDGAGADEPRESRGSFLFVAFLAPIVGVYAGFIGALFRVALEKTGLFHAAVVAWAQGHGLPGILALIALVVFTTAVASFLVRAFSPYASGSGIPHVEAVIHGELAQASLTLVPVKFAGGLLAIGSGLALGREGPSVQMGATIAHLIGRVFGCDWSDCRALLAAGAGAGLATAFNAPIAGAVFVLEELVGRFDPKMAIAALGASTTAISVARVLIPDVPDFALTPLAAPVPEVHPLSFVLGAIAGLFGLAYNRIMLATLRTFGRLPVAVRPGLVGAVVGVVAWLSPSLVGGGDALTGQALAGHGTVAVLPVIFLVRGSLGFLSYASGTPGGIFAPLLALGAQLGLWFGLLCALMFPGLGLEPRGFAVIGMAALFTGIVRAPVTGIVLITEMTADTTMLLPMLAACFVAMLVPTLLGNPPIYDSLRRLAVEAQREVEHSLSTPGKAGTGWASRLLGSIMRR